jgi:4-aminobutyrate aminotransferase-like enzyme
MQNLSGYRSFSPTFASSLTNLCRSKSVLLIADEVFTGFGRCGQWSLAQSQGFSPDISVYGKALTGGIPGGVCVADRELLGHLYPRNGPPLHAPTFFNAPVVCAAMSSSIEILRSESLLPRSKQIGERLARALLPLATSLPGVRTIRGHGAAQAIEFQSHDGLASEQALALTMCRNLLDLGVLALNSGFPRGNVVTLCPPLVISDAQLDAAIERIQEALALTANGREYG